MFYCKNKALFINIIKREKKPNTSFIFSSYSLFISKAYKAHLHIPKH